MSSRASAPFAEFTDEVIAFARHYEFCVQIVLFSRANVVLLARQRLNVLFHDVLDKRPREQLVVFVADLVWNEAKEEVEVGLHKEVVRDLIFESDVTEEHTACCVRARCDKDDVLSNDLTDDWVDNAYINNGWF